MACGSASGSERRRLLHSSLSELVIRDVIQRRCLLSLGTLLPSYYIEPTHVEPVLVGVSNLSSQARQRLLR